MTKISCEPTIATDHSLRIGEADRLGYSDVAQNVASILLDHDFDDSLTIGLEGRWGSGKTSLLTLIVGRMTAMRPHSVVHFKPWLVGDRHALLIALFNELNVAIAHIEAEAGDASRETRQRAAAVATAIGGFAEGIARFGDVLEFAGDAIAFGPVKIAGKGLKTARVWSKKLKETPLSTLKAKLSNALKKLDRRIIVTIDDLDRLEPHELIEVLRLVRSVADLPGIVYLLCYDSDVLAEGIRIAAKVDGQAYLEKIVQLTIPVPQPEAFQLRHWFAEELERIAGSISDDTRDRLKTVIDLGGSAHLHTPRSVKRTLLTLRMLWPVLRDLGADFADLVWLQLIKTDKPAFYRWIESYSASAAEVSLGTARVGEAEGNKTHADLLRIVGDDYFLNDFQRSLFAEILPGINQGYGDKEPPFTLFSKVSIADRQRAISSRRLASPDHFRIYFALAPASYALLQSDYDDFWAATDADADKVGQLLLDFHCQATQRTLGKADLLLERLYAAGTNDFTPLRSANLLIAFADTLDEAARRRPFDRTWVTSLWDRAQRLVPGLLSLLEPTERLTVLERMFANGSALSWLTDAFRHDTFAQGRFGDRIKSEREWLFTAAEYDAIAGWLLTRYRSLNFNQLLEQISPRSIMYAWSQGGGAEDVLTKMTEFARDDIAFLRILNALSSSTRTSEGDYEVLKRANIEPFFDYDAARKRLTVLAESNDPAISSLAVPAIRSIEDGDRF